MRLFRSVHALAEGVVTSSPKVSATWNIGILPAGGVLLSSDNFSLKLDAKNFGEFLRLVADKKSGEIRDRRLDLIFVEPGDGKSFILTRQGDKTFPSGIQLTIKQIADIAQFVTGEKEDEPVAEGVKVAFRRSGQKIKRGFRVTSGVRKGRVVANIRTASKPRAPAATRVKMRLASKKKRVIRVMKGRLTRKKSLSKRLVRMNRRR